MFSVLLIALIVGGVGSFVSQTAEAQTATFPAGCSSGLGYNATTGQPCSGTSTAIPKFMPGCTTALGYSSTTGLPCSGSSVAIEWLAGCTSKLGYSSVDGTPCNGTNVATFVVVPPSSPGLPTTGFGGNALSNVILLLSFLTLAVAGATYLVLDYKRASR